MSMPIPVNCDSMHAKLLCIEFPCIIENEDAVIRGLDLRKLPSKLAAGTDAAIEWKRPLKSPSSMSGLAAIPTQQPRFIHPLVGRVVEPVQPRLVLKLRRNKASRKIMSMACLGIMTESIVFGREMADFQFCIPQQRTAFLAPLSHLAECAHVDTLDTIITHLEQSTSMTDMHATACLFPPPFFTAYQIPIIYNYAAYPLPPSQPTPLSPATFSQPTLPKNTRGLRHLASHYRSIYDSSTKPLAPSPTASLLPEQLVLQLTELLQQRPIWSSLAMYRQFELTSEHAALKRALKTLAFYWYDGPWRGCWNRMDYDPRSQPDARIYQILELRSLAKERPSNATTASHVLDETGIQSNLYQYIDIKDKDALTLLANKKEWSSSFHPKLGWWRPGFREKIMAILKLKYRATSNSGLEISRGIRFPRRPRPSQRMSTARSTEPLDDPSPQPSSSFAAFDEGSDYEEADRDDHDDHHDMDADMGVDVDDEEDDIYQIFEDELYSDDD